MQIPLRDIIRRRAGELPGAHPLEIIIRAMFAGVGFLLLSIVLWQAGVNMYVLQTYEHAEAEVISTERVGPVAYKGLNRYGVQVRFLLPDGRNQTASVDDPVTSFDVGEVIDIYYQMETAYTVIAGGYQQMWFHISMIAAVASVLLFFGLRPPRKD